MTKLGRIYQCTFDGEIVALFKDAKEASEVTGTGRNAIYKCCRKGCFQSNGFIWIYEKEISQLQDRINSMLNPVFPIEWGNDWRDVKGLEGKYKVSEKGVVAMLPKFLKGKDNSLRFMPLKAMKRTQNPLGYWMVSLPKNGRINGVFLHRIMAEAFIPNPDNLPFINHKDENPANYSLDNLEWCTQKYNVNYGTCKQKMSEKHINNHLLSKRVLQCDMQGNLIKEWPSIAEATRDEYSRAPISKCCNGHIASYKGYIWKFKNAI